MVKLTGIKQMSVFVLGEEGNVIEMLGFTADLDGEV